MQLTYEQYRDKVRACLAPGHPEIAVEYARQDAICDHAHEGMYAEIFCAALQSAAFVESDREKLMEAALSYIPEDCAITELAFSVTPGMLTKCRYDLLLEIVANGRLQKLFIELPLLTAAN